jgi:NAD(P)-dependent dehydrogenase (short-subunit alcohol dehydrogenase family)
MTLANFTRQTAREIARGRVADLLRGGQGKEIPRSLQGKTVLITGGTSGIGRATAEQMAKAGARVILLGRDGAKALQVKTEMEQAIPGACVDYVLADLSDPKSVKQALGELRHKIKRLDVLVNNAGGPRVRFEETGGVEKTFGSNHLGHFQLTLGLVPKLAPDARIISIASGLHRNAEGDVAEFAHPKQFDPMRAYANAKLSQIYFTEELARRLASTNITVVAMDPGPTKTNVMLGQGGAMDGLLKLGVKVASPLFRDASDAGAAVVQLATLPSVSGHSGGYYELNHLSKPSKRARDVAQARAIWDDGVELLHVYEPKAVCESI